MRQPCIYLPDYTTLLLALSEENSCFFLILTFFKITFHQRLFSLIFYNATGIFVFGQHFFRHLDKRIGIHRTPRENIGSFHQRQHRTFLHFSLFSNGNSTYNSLPGFNFRKINEQLAIHSLSLYHSAESTVMPAFCPNVKIINQRFAIYGYVKDTESLTISFFTAPSTMPRLCKIEFYTIASRFGYRETIVKMMASETKTLEKRPITCTMYRIESCTLACLIGRDRIELFSP